MTIFQAKLIATIYLFCCITSFVLGFYYLGQYLEKKEKRDLIQCILQYICGTLESIVILMTIFYLN